MREIIQFNYSLNSTTYSFNGDNIYYFETNNIINEGYYLGIVNNDFRKTGYNSSVIIYIFSKPLLAGDYRYYVLNIESNLALSNYNITHIIKLDYYKHDFIVINGDTGNSLVDLIKNEGVSLVKFLENINFSENSFSYYFRNPDISKSDNDVIIDKKTKDLEISNKQVWEINTGFNSQGVYTYDSSYFIDKHFPRFILIQAKAYDLESDLSLYFEYSLDGTTWNILKTINLKVSSTYFSYYFDIIDSVFTGNNLSIRLRVVQPNLSFGKLTMYYQPEIDRYIKKFNIIL